MDGPAIRSVRYFRSTIIRGPVPAWASRLDSVVSVPASFQRSGQAHLSPSQQGPLPFVSGCSIVALDEPHDILLCAYRTIRATPTRRLTVETSPESLRQDLADPAFLLSCKGRHVEQAFFLHWSL